MLIGDPMSFSAAFFVGLVLNLSSEKVSALQNKKLHQRWDSACLPINSNNWIIRIVTTCYLKYFYC